MTGIINIKDLEKSLLSRLEDPEEWERFLDETKGDWSYDPDASYDNGCWSDDSRWYWLGEYLGYKVEITATPEEWNGRHARYEEEPPIGEVSRVRVLG